MSRLRGIACVLATAALLVPALALADSPTDTTTTEPVSTVVTVPAPTSPAVTAPAPDAAPAHKAAHTRAKPVVHSAQSPRRAVTPAQPTAPLRISPQPQSSRPVTITHPAKKAAVHHRHRATPSPPRRHPPRPATKAPKPARAPAPTPVPAPAGQSAGNSWIAPAGIGGLIALLAALALFAGIRETRRPQGPESPQAVVPPPISTPAAAPATPIASEPEFEPATAALATPASCRIAWWRGYMRSRFYAYEEDDGEPVLVAESPLFPWRSSAPPPESPAALAAYASLVEKLGRLGWEADGGGETWFSGRFRRTVADASHHYLAQTEHEISFGNGIEPDRAPTLSLSGESNRETHGVFGHVDPST